MVGTDGGAQASAPVVCLTVGVGVRYRVVNVFSPGGSGAMTSGKRGNYWWFSWSCNNCMDELLHQCPTLIIGRYVAVVAFDCSPMVPNDAEVARGWTSSDEVAYSPLVHDLDEVGRGNHDEWYIKPEPFVLPSTERFVSWVAFRLSPAPELEEVQERFWKQIESVAPESYLAEGDNLVLATRNDELAAAVRRCNALAR